MASEHRLSILRTADEVTEWRESLQRRLVARPVSFDLDILSDPENQRLGERAERYRRVCGCEAGGIAGMLAVTMAAILWLVPASRPALSLISIIQTIGGIIAAALLARLAALGWARLSLVRLAGEIERRSH
jgi:hypothetical protein